MESRQSITWKLVTAPLWIIGMVLFGVIFLALLPILAPVKILYEYYERSTFCRRFDGRIILIWAPRHKWSAFVVNNLIPVLSQNVEPIPNPGNLVATESLMGLGLAKRNCNSTGLRRPYLFSVRDRQVTFVGLHEELLPFKGNQKPDPTVQMRIASIVESKLLQLTNAHAIKLDKTLD